MIGLHLIKHLLCGSPVKATLGFVLAVEAVLTLVLALDEVPHSFLGAVCDEVILITATVAPLGRTTTPTVQAVVVEPRELGDDQGQLIISKSLHLFLCHGDQR